MAERKARWQNDYIARTYDRINLTVPKGQKDLIKAHAESQGKSVNSFINEHCTALGIEAIDLVVYDLVAEGNNVINKEIDLAVNKNEAFVCNNVSVLAVVVAGKEGVRYHLTVLTEVIDSAADELIFK